MSDARKIVERLLEADMDPKEFAMGVEGGYDEAARKAYTWLVNDLKTSWTPEMVAQTKADPEKLGRLINSLARQIAQLYGFGEEEEGDLRHLLRTTWQEQTGGVRSSILDPYR